MLQRLRDMCQQRRLPNFWDPSHNMIEAEENQLSGIVGRLAKLMKEIEHDPGSMADWLRECNRSSLVFSSLAECSINLNISSFYSDVHGIEFVSGRIECSS